MGIYSNNRSGSMGVAQIGANTSYTPTDIGRIMYEAACNDQALFEATLLNDMRELKGLSEGTILQSEVAALNEASLKEFATKAQETLKKIWEKLKGAFQVAMQNIAAYVLRDGKAFAEKYERVAASSTKSGSVKGVVRTNFNVAIPTTSSLEELIRASKNDSEVAKKTVIGQQLAKAAGESGTLTPKEFQKKVLEKAFNKDAEIKTGSPEVTAMLKSLKDASASVKKLNQAKKDAEKCIKAAGDNIKRTEKDAGNKDAVKTIGILVSSCQTVLSVTTSASIKIVRSEVTQARKNLGRLMANMKGESDTVQEAAALEGEDEVESALDDTVDTAPDSEVDAIVAAAENE